MWSIISIAILVFIIFAFTAIVLIRNEKVYKFKMTLVDMVSEAAKNDIEQGHFNWIWRYDELQKVSYDEFVLKFWVPLKPEYWWENTMFLEKIEY